MLVTVGLLILLFVAYQLWGTGILTARAQHDLERRFNALRDDPTLQSTTSSSTSSSTSRVPPKVTTTSSPTAPAVVQVVKEGDPIGRLRIPRIGVDRIIVQGTARHDLSKGPGHYPATPMPGQIGNAAVAGHRTTNGKPFYDLNELKPGDDILVDTKYGHFVYRVTEKLVVSPRAIEVVGPTPNPQLTLTTCNPRYSARQRLVIHSRLVVASSDPARANVPVRVVEPSGDSKRSTESSLEQSLSGDTSSRLPTLMWGLISLLVGALWWWIYRRWRHPVTWLVGIAPFLLVLFAFYVYLERLLPANF